MQRAIETKVHIYLWMWLLNWNIDDDDNGDEDDVITFMYLQGYFYYIQLLCTYVQLQYDVIYQLKDNSKGQKKTWIYRLYLDS